MDTFIDLPTLFNNTKPDNTIFSYINGEPLSELSNSLYNMFITHCNESGLFIENKQYATKEYSIDDFESYSYKNDTVTFSIKDNKLTIGLHLYLLHRALDQYEEAERIDKMIERVDLIKIVNTFLLGIKQHDISLIDRYLLLPLSIRSSTDHYAVLDNEDQYLLNISLEVKIVFDIVDNDLYKPPSLNGDNGGALYIKSRDSFNKRQKKIT